MPAPKWLVVARNEYRIHTSRIRKIRSYFPYLVIGLLVVYVAFIAPGFVSLFIDDFLAFILSQAAVAMIQIILFIIFIYFMIIPITDTLREEQTGQLEIFLAAPIKPSDVLLGEFLGEMPFYAIFVTVIIGFFTAVLNPLGLDLVQVLIIIIIFVVTFLSALWIGTVIAAILRTRLGKTARGKDIGKALALLIALPMVGIMYAIMGGGLIEALANPSTSGMVRTILGVLPSSWGAEVIVGFASSPGNIGAVGFETLTRFGGLVAFFVAVLWLGTKVANRAYSLEPTIFVASRAKADGIFYKTVKYLGGGGSFGTLLVSIFKDYGRRLENLSNITYIIGILVLMNIFIVPSASTGPDEPPVAWMMNQFMLPMLAAMVVCGVTSQEKENLFIFKKTPSGVARLVKTRLVQSWLVVVPIAGAITAVTTILSSQNTFISLLTNTGLMMSIVAANVAFILGLFLLNPTFSRKSVMRPGPQWLNILMVEFVSVGLFVVSMFVLTGQGPEPIGGILHIQLLQAVLSWLVGIVFLYLGKRKLRRIE